MLSRKERKEKKEARGVVHVAMQEFGYEDIRSHLILDGYRCRYREDTRFVEEIRNKYQEIIE